MRSVATAAVVVCLGLWAAPVAASDYRVDSWTTQHGLPQDSVTAVIQSRDGYLWLGTFGGLVRVDGMALTTVGLSPGTGLRSVRILALIEARDGALREIAYDLRPYHLDQLGLRRTIEVMLDRLGRPGGVRSTSDVAALDGALPKPAGIGVHRIVQEAATNVPVVVERAMYLTYLREAGAPGW